MLRASNAADALLQQGSIMNLLEHEHEGEQEMDGLPWMSPFFAFFVEALGVHVYVSVC